MITVWARGLARHRTGRLLAALTGIALAVALVAALGSFLTASKATMTQRALRSVSVDWQVQVQPGADPGSVISLVRRAPGTRAALPVGYARTAGFTARVQGSTQTTGPGMALGLPDGYRTLFPDAIRTLSGASAGVLLAQQTASNLHAAPGDTVAIQLPGVGTRQVKVDGVVDLPQADSLFQTVGAPSQSQPTAPPDNVVLLPATRFAALTRGSTGTTTQIHVARDTTRLPSDPAAAYTAVTGAAHNLEARSAGTTLVGNNVGAALDSARQDALYAQILFLFLGVPGAVLAAALTVAVASAGGERRRQEQGLLRLRGLRPGQITRLAGLEAALIGLLGGLAGLGIAALTGRLAFGSASFGVRYAELTTHPAQYIDKSLPAESFDRILLD
ncbi:ABC transporter permease, partial [Streptomyces sp. NPDC001215]